MSAEEKTETANKSQTALLYMVHQMAAQVSKESGMQFSKQVTQQQLTLCQPFHSVLSVRPQAIG